jgi:hypothetical protein
MGPWGQRQCWAIYKRGSASSYNPTFAPPVSFIFQPNLLLFPSLLVILKKCLSIFLRNSMTGIGQHQNGFEWHA